MIRLTLLGPTACVGDAGDALEAVARSRKRLALLAYLAVARPPGLHRRDTLVGLLWADSDQKRARASLRQAVRHLRGELGDAVISRGTEELGLDWSRFWCDAVAFRDLVDDGRPKAALNLYDRPLLAGFYLSRAPGFEVWLDQERRALQREAAEAAWSLADAAAETESAAKWARRAAAFTPYDEASARRLMSFLENRGEAVGALQAFERFSKRVHEEFGGAPSAETRAVAAGIRLGAGSGGQETPRTAERSERRGLSLPAAPTVAGTRTPSVDIPVAVRVRSPGRGAKITASLAVALVSVATASWAINRGGDLDFSRVSRITSAEGAETMPALSPTGDRVAYVAGTPGATNVFMRRISGGTPIQLTANSDGVHLRPAWAPDGEYIGFLTLYGQGHTRIRIVPATGGPARVLYDEPDGDLVDGLSWSPDGRRLAFVRGRTLVTIDVESEEIRELGHAWAPHSLAWSPDGGRIAFVSENSEYALGSNVAPSSIWMFPAEGGAPTRITKDEGTDQSPVWWPDGRHLLFISDRDGASHLFSVGLDDDGRPVGAPSRWAGTAGLLGISLSADGRALAYSAASVDWDIWSIPFPSGADTAHLSDAKRVTSAEQSIEFLSLSPDGRWIAYDSNREGNQDIYRVPVEGGEPERITRHAADDFAPVWSPDGNEIAFYTFRNGNRDIYVMEADGRQRTQVTRTPASESFPHWSPHEDALLFQSNPASSETDRLTIQRVERMSAGDWGTPELVIDGAASSPRSSPDGRWIAYRAGRQLSVKSLETGESQVLDPGMGAVGPLIWSADGGTIYFAATREGTGGIWGVSVMGGDAWLVARSDRPFGRFWFDTDGETIYFAGLESREADVWIGELRGKP